MKLFLDFDTKKIITPAEEAEMLMLATTPFTFLKTIKSCNCLLTCAIYTFIIISK